MAVSGSSSGGGGAVRAGKAFVELGVNDSGLLRGLERAKAKVMAFGAAFAKASVGVGAGLSGAGGSLLAPLGAAFEQAISRGVEFSRLGAKLGVPVDQLSAFAYAAETTGVSLEQLEGHFENLAERVAQGAMNTGEAAETFRKLGVNAAELQLQNPVDQLVTLSGAMQKFTNDTERLGMLSSLGGDQFQKLNDLFKQGPAAIRALTAEAARVGAVVNPAEAKQAVQVWGSLNRVWVAAKNSVAAVGAALLPSGASIEVVSAAVVGILGSLREWVAENRQVVLAVAAVGAGLVAAGSALAAFGLAAQAVAAGVGAAFALASAAVVAFKAVLAAGAAVLAAVFSPVGLAIAGVVAAVGGIGYAFATMTDTGRGAVTSVKGFFGDLLTSVAGVARDVLGTFTAAWAGISEAIEAGDLKRAGAIAMAALTVEFRRGILGLTQAWNWFQSTFVDVWHRSVHEAALAWIDTQAEVEKLWVGAAELFTGTWGDAMAQFKAGWWEGVEVAGKALKSFGEAHITVAQKAGRAITDLLVAAWSGGGDALDAAQKGADAALEKIGQSAAAATAPNRRAQIEADRNAEKERQKKEFADAQAGREAARREREAEARRRFEQAQADLKKLLEPGVEAAPLPREVAAKIAAVNPQIAAARGQFGGAGAAQVFGTGVDIPKQQLQAAKDGNELTRDLIAAVKGIRLPRIS